MKKLIILLFAFAFIAPSVHAQNSLFTTGVSISYDTTGAFAAATMLKRVGTVNMLDGFDRLDSLGIFASFSDSVRVSFYVIPRSTYKTPAIADTVAAVLPAATATYYHVADGASHVSVPWYKIRAAITDLTVKAPTFDVYVRIHKIAGLHTYGTTSTGKAAGKMTVTLTPHR